MKSKNSVRLFIIILILICISAGGWFIYKNMSTPPPVVVEPPPVTEPAPTPTPIPVGPQDFVREDGETPVPVRIEIAALNINAPVEPVGVDSEGRMGTSNKGENVAWYKYGPVPGFKGNSLLNGHNNWNKRNAVFAKLPSLALGEPVTIYYEDGSWGTFKVSSNEVYPLDDIPDHVMSPEGLTRTTIISCTGTYITRIGTHDHRCVVLLEQLDYFLPEA